MIFLRPVGGLCNRLRAVDSLITFSNLLNQDLTILWVLSPNLNARLSSLYDLEKLNKSNIKVIEIDPKESFKKKIVAKLISNLERRNKGLIRKFDFFVLKILLGNPKLKLAYSNNELSAIANSNQEVKEYSAIEHENNLIDSIEGNLKEMVHENGGFYIESCYRVTRLNEKEPYTGFIPPEDIKEKVEAVTAAYTNTIGIHIRRSDHHYAIENSPTKMFEKIVAEHLQLDQKNTAFLCTDDQEIREEFKKTFQDKVILSPISSLDRNDPDAIKDAVVDLHCLAATSRIYGSHFSSFSQVASDIGKVELVTVLK